MTEHEQKVVDYILRNRNSFSKTLAVGNSIAILRHGQTYDEIVITASR